MWKNRVKSFLYTKIYIRYEESLILKNLREIFARLKILEMFEKKKLQINSSSNRGP